jgi:2-oxoisovalerate dehydrogenase E1 component
LKRFIVTADIDTKNKIDKKNANFAREALTSIAFIRAFEQKAWSFSHVSPPTVPGSMHFCAGQEAVAVGAIAGLREDDQVIATYRGHGWALASGLDARSVMAELCLRDGGINQGRGGSAYMMAPSTRFIGENSIVGAGTTMACGVAISNVIANNKRVVVVTIGDGAMNQGSVHEAMAFAAVRSLPVIFIVENNGWSELTATADMFKVARVAQRAAGYGIPSATIDGTDPFAVRDTIALAAARARNGEGPSLLEFRVPRLWGHYNKDIEHYRKKDDKAEAQARDPLKVMSDRIVASQLLSRDEVDGIVAEQTRIVDEMTAEVLASPAPAVEIARNHVIAMPDAAQKFERTESKEISYIEAVNAALRAELESDERTIVFGEDVGKAGGIFGATRYLQRDFGEQRVFDTPIAENAILGAAVGAAVTGRKPIAEIMWADFIFVALDQIINQASNVRYITGGKNSVPMVVRTQQGVTPGSCAQHSQSIEAILAHIPGVKVALAASPQDAYDLLRSAAADPDPCVVIEARGLYQMKETVSFSTGAEPAGKARLLQDGSDCAIITWGTMVPRAKEAAAALKERGVDETLLDLRWLSPLDEPAIARAVGAAKGRVLIVHEAVRTGGFAGEIAMRVNELAPHPSLTIRRLTTPDVRIPAAPQLQEALIPNSSSIVDAVTEIIGK